MAETASNQAPVTEDNKPDWQVTTIAACFVEEVDCNSGNRRRVWKSGKTEAIQR